MFALKARIDAETESERECVFKRQKERKRTRKIGT